MGSAPLLQDLEALSIHTQAFLDFPGSKGIDVSDLEAGDIGERSLEEVLAFLQSWCFLGMLTHTMWLCGVDVTEGQFLTQKVISGIASAGVHRPQTGTETVVTSVSFPALLRQVEGQSRIGRTVPEIRNVVYQEFLRTIQAVMQFMRNINLAPRHSLLRPSVEQDTSDPDLRDSIMLSIFLLGDFLHYLLMLWLPPDTSPTEPDWGHLRYFPYLRRKLLEAGWCPSEINLLADQPIGLSTLTYLSLIDRTTFGKQHQPCANLREPFACCYEQLKVYTTLHASTCARKASCKDVDVAKFKGQSLHQIVNARNIPVVSVHKSVRQGATKSYRPDQQYVIECNLSPAPAPGIQSASNISTRYIAFSHVWQDGLGNKTANALPACQLIRLQALADSIFDGASQPVPFWLDTLCVPIQEPHRGKAIGNMHEIYARAEVVLVLDSAILEKATDTTHPFELLMTVRTSGWTRRLWTFQEGILACNLRFQFADRAWSVDDIQLAIIEASTPGGHPLQDASSKSQEEGSASEQRLLNANNLIYPSLKYLEQIQKPNYLEHEEQNTLSKRLEQISMPLCWRSTSRASDEPICLSNILAMPDPVRRRIITSPGRRRMEALIAEFDQVPANILFVNRPRFQSKGLRWLPQSFLGGGRQATMFGVESSTARVIKSNSVITGLMLSGPGFLLTGTINYEDMFFAELELDTDGTEGTDNQFGAGTGVGVVIMADPTSPSPINTRHLSTRRLAVLLKEPLSWTLLEQDIAPGTMGVLVSVVERVGGTEAETDAPLVVRYEQLVKVFLAVSEPLGREKGDMRVQDLAEGQKWIIQ